MKKNLCKSAELKIKVQLCLKLGCKNIQTWRLSKNKKVLFKTTVNFINEIKAIKYSKDQINYYDTQAKKKEVANRHFGSNTLPDIFAKFDSPGEYNGIPLSVKLCKNFFTIYGEPWDLHAG